MNNTMNTASRLSISASNDQSRNCENFIFCRQFKLNEVNEKHAFAVVNLSLQLSSMCFILSYLDRLSLYLLEKIFYVEIKSILIQFQPRPGSCDQSSSVDILFRKNNTFSSATENMIFSASAKIKLKPTWNISLFTLIKYQYFPLHIPILSIITTFPSHPLPCYNLTGIGFLQHRGIDIQDSLKIDRFPIQGGGQANIHCSPGSLDFRVPISQKFVL